MGGLRTCDNCRELWASHCQLHLIPCCPKYPQHDKPGSGTAASTSTAAAPLDALAAALDSLHEGLSAKRVAAAYVAALKERTLTSTTKAGRAVRTKAAKNALREQYPSGRATGTGYLNEQSRHFYDQDRDLYRAIEREAAARVLRYYGFEPTDEAIDAILAEPER